MSNSARVRRVALSIALVALCALLVLAVARSQPGPSLKASATATARPTADAFTRYLFSPQLPDFILPLHPGQSVTLTWKPVLVPNQQITTPTPVDCSVVLYGPFTSPDIAQRAASMLHSGDSSVTPSIEVSTIPVALVGSTLTVDDLTNTPQTSMVTLPDSFATGYYLFEAQSRGVIGTFASNAVISVEPASA